MMKKNQAGLSLLEVLFSIAILAMMMAAIAGGFSQFNRVSVSQQYQTRAIQDAARMLEQVRKVANESGVTAATSATYWSTAGGTGWLETSAAQFNVLPEVERSITFPDGTAGNPLHVRATVTWQEQGNPKSYSMDMLVTERT